MIILVDSKTPGVGGSLILKVALREIHLVASIIYGELAGNLALGARYCSTVVRHEVAVAFHHEVLAGIG